MKSIGKLLAEFLHPFFPLISYYSLLSYILGGNFSVNSFGLCLQSLGVKLSKNGQKWVFVSVCERVLHAQNEFNNHDFLQNGCNSTRTTFSKSFKSIGDFLQTLGGKKFWKIVKNSLKLTLMNVLHPEKSLPNHPIICCSKFIKSNLLRFSDSNFSFPEQISPKLCP